MKLHAIVLCLVVAGCAKPALTPEQLLDYENTTLYTCCNIHYDGDTLSDANYHVGTTMPLGTSVKITGVVKKNGFTFTAGPMTFTMYLLHGSQQETMPLYIDKIFLREDPAPLITRYSEEVQDAIRESRVERGMTREQVIFSVGYPPTQHTPKIAADEWTYWYNQWVTYQVVFADDKVTNIIGSSAPTRGLTVH